MKNIITILAISIIITSCGKAPKVSQDLQNLINEKAIIKQQIDSLSSKLQIIETAISDLDTLKRLVVVTTFQPKQEVFKHFIEVQGTVKADKSVELHPEMGGNVTRIFVKEGQRVSKGQTLAQLDASVLNNNIAQMQTQLSLAKTTFERQERLWKQNIGSEIQYLQAKANKEGLENNLNSLYSQANKMKIKAPFSGTIDQVFAKVGELANPQMPFLRVINLSNVYIESDITESYLASIKKGTEVEVSFPSLNKNMNSKITQVGNFINPNNRSFKARIDITNQEGDIKANLLADIRINDFSANGIVIPSNTIQEDSEGNNFVYTVNKEKNKSKVVKSFVNVVKEYKNQSYISEGLKASDIIIDKGSKLVKSGDEVSIVQ
ncbi:MAG: efflux RND transporter periplasmic adaptor subunit [Flaviramulus sp.]|nr:efflux RND transporter periplasmic adaptor subunit [Flaviramulus sp.]NNC50140.1 efflux RND transporter periplasmic adaptor subunit [Flaviramulus sp.]